MGVVVPEGAGDVSVAVMTQECEDRASQYLFTDEGMG